MMTAKPSAIVIVCVLAAIAVFLFAIPQSDEDVAVDALIDRENQRKTLAETDDLSGKTDLDRLAREGKGRPVPAHLETELDTLAGHYVVGGEGLPHVAEIPFEPGNLPRPASQSDPQGENPGFLGVDACASCHQEKHASYIHTAHYKTSRLADADSVLGSLEHGDNVLRTSNPNVSFEMIRRGDSAFQRNSFYDWQFDIPMQIIFGTAKMGESYAYWDGDKLYQANCTCLADGNRWINSPGYTEGNASNARPILPGCIECHSTYVDVRAYPNRYTPSSLLLGISCERCHGPGKDHVDYHLAHPDEKKAHAVTVPSDLSRQQQIDLCGQCHAANKRLGERAAFQFRPGDRLDQHYEITDPEKTNSEVHASNQANRLSRSECFQNSEMACYQCHNPHRLERGNMKLFSERCLQCHDEKPCSFPNEDDLVLESNCVDCHMPKGEGVLHLDTAEGSVFPPLRDHYIRVDPEATKAFLQVSE